MRIPHVKIGMTLMLLLALAVIGIAACGGGDGGSSPLGGGGSDSDKIQARVKSFFDHLTKADAKGVINDLPPDLRKGCDENQIKQALALVKAFDIKLKDSKIKSISGDKAQVDITTSGTIAGQASDSTETEPLVKVGNDWYVDTEGKTCGELLNPS